MVFKRTAAIAAGFVAASCLTLATAATLSEEVTLCAAAADAKGLAASVEYRPNFISQRGAASKRLTIELIPHNSGEVLTAECNIRRGEVIDVALKA